MVLLSEEEQMLDGQKPWRLRPWAAAAGPALGVGPRGKRGPSCDTQGFPHTSLALCPCFLEPAWEVRAMTCSEGLHCCSLDEAERGDN